MQAVVKKTPQANEDLYEIWYFIAVERQNPQNADRFILQLNDAFLKMAANPTMGIQKNEYAHGLYQFPFKNYQMFYFSIDDGIEIIRVLHGARDLPELF